MTRTSLTFVLIAIILLYTAVGYPWIYIARETSGTIVDSHTGTPISGAIVVAQWIAYVQKPGHGDHNYVVKALETVTDADGRFMLQGWGPKLRVPFTELDRFDPIVSIVKDRYHPREFSNHRSRSNIVRFSEWDGSVIELDRFMGNDQEFASKLGTISTRFDISGFNWRKYPNVLLELDRLRRVYKKRGVSDVYLSGILSLDKIDEKYKDEIRRLQNE